MGPRRILYILIATALCGLFLRASDETPAPPKEVTFNRDVAPILNKNCVVCHRATDQPQVAPDLGALADKPVETFLIAILDPNRAAEARYVNYMATTKDGREPSGIIVAETGNSITLRSQNSEETILRSDLESLTSSGLSLMPEGFEKSLTPQNLADIIAFLRKGSGPKLEAGGH